MDRPAHRHKSLLTYAAPVAFLLALAAAPAGAELRAGGAEGEATPGPPKAGLIGRDDLLEIIIVGPQGAWVENKRVVRVNNRGVVSLPYVEPFKIAGLSTAAAEDAITKTYRDICIDMRPDYVSVRRLELDAAATAKSGPAAPGDLLRITIGDLVGPGVRRPYDARVDADGRVALPYVGGVKVAGLDEIAIEGAVADAYRADGLVERAEVVVLKLESAAQSGAKPGGPLAPGDLLIVSVPDVQGPGVETVFPVRIGEDGKARLPFAGPVKLAGLSEAGAAESVAEAFHTTGERRPGVWVSRVESADTPGVRPGPIERGDLLRVSIESLHGPGQPALKVTRVGPGGRVTLPYVGGVAVAGKSEAAVAEAIAKAYEDQDIQEKAAVLVLKVESAPVAGEDGRTPDLPDVPTRPLPAALRALLEPPAEAVPQ